MSARINIKSEICPENTVHATTAGLAAGSKVLSMKGRTPIEQINIGDRIITRSGVRVVRDVQRRIVETRPVKVSANTQGYSSPETDLWMTSDQEIQIRDCRAQLLFGHDKVILPISRLVDGRFVTKTAANVTLEIVSLHFDGPEIFYANGMEILSGIGTTNRATKQNQKIA